MQIMKGNQKDFNYTPSDLLSDQLIKRRIISNKRNVGNVLGLLTKPSQIKINIESESIHGEIKDKENVFLES